jgi:hypothetical protein
MGLSRIALLSGPGRANRPNETGNMHMSCCVLNSSAVLSCSVESTIRECIQIVAIITDQLAHVRTSKVKFLYFPLPFG